MAEIYVTTTENEEWIWVEGYKGTHDDMTCIDFQYEIGKQFDMPEDASIVSCASGFHLCLELEQVFRYYHIGRGNRFFKVRALVRKADVDRGYRYPSRSDKLVAKSIEFVRELTPDEIFKGSFAESWSDEHKRLALNVGLNTVKHLVRKEELLACGYSKYFTEYLIAMEMTDTALAVGSQKDLSMDVKVMTILLGGMATPRRASDYKRILNSIYGNKV